mgnify:CR=1 FL=1
MDKYEYKVKLAQIEKLAAKKDFVTAAKIADGIDWRKVKSVTTLNLIADIYEKTKRLEDCYEILNMVYDRSPVSRRVVFHMAEIATKMHDFEEAIALYKEFVKIAPHDLNKYILKYQIYRERGSSVNDQILILEEFKSHEYDEHWAYELACLYEEAGLIDQCIEECDELILWFSEGEYVTKAMELKLKYQELTLSQQEKYEHRFDYLEEMVEDEFAEENSEEFEQEAPVVEETVETEAASPEEELPVVEEVVIPEEDDTPQVSVINTNKFSTMNLQEELAKGLQMILAQEAADLSETKPAVTQEFIPVKEVVIPREEEVPAVKEVPVEEEVPAVEEVPVEEEVPAVEEVPVEEEVPAVEEVPVEEELPVVEEPPVEEKAPQEESAAEEVKTTLSETAELKSEILKYISASPEPKMEEMLCTEEDGQMSLAIGQESILEKQITGQMTIEEILEAWEEKKRLAKEQIEKAEEKKNAVLFETGEITSLLEDFIPTTPIEREPAQEELPVIEEEPAQEELPVIEEEPAQEELPVIEEEPAQEELPAIGEEVAEEELPVIEEEFEDDLPQDIDLSEALEAALEEPKDEEPKTETVGQSTASMLDAIERALATEIEPIEIAGKYLTEEQEKIFAYFTSVKGMKKQLVTLLGGDSEFAGREDSKVGNLVITGHPGNGKTTLAIDIVKAFQKQRKVKGGKLAKVTGDGLNKKNPEEVINKLGGGALIIERASGLSDETIEKLSEVMEGNTGGLLVILEDDSKEISKLLEKNRSFAEKFNRCIDIPIFSNDELVAFGKSYAEEQEYYFDEMAVLALYDCIGVRQTADHVVNITEVKEFVDDAIAHAEKKSRGLFARLSRKRIDEEGNKLLLEEDFDC